MKNEMNGAEAMVRSLESHGVQHIFGLCGDTTLPFYDAMLRLDHKITHVLTRDGKSTAGYVTSAFHSPNLGRSVALGLVAGARSREGEQVEIFYEGKSQPARLVRPAFYDPEGEALNG